MELLKSLEWRYATKKFDPLATVSQEQLDTLSRAFNLTATSYGLQPVRLIIVQNKTLQEKMVGHCYGQRQVADCSALLVLCSTPVDASYVAGYFELVKKTRNTDDAVLKPFETFLKDSFSQKEENEIRDWARNQAYLVMGNLLTVCAAAGIDSCPMEGFDPAAIDKLLGLNPQGLNSILLLPVGTRAADDLMATQKKVRMAQNDIVRYIK